MFFLVGLLLILLLLVDAIAAQNPIQHYPQSVLFPSCLRERGKRGVWIPDMEYAKVHAQYLIPAMGRVGASDRQYRTRYLREKPFKIFSPYRPETIYRWRDQVCHVQLVTRSRLCQLFRAYNITRLFFLGDSMTHEQAMSMWMLMKQPERKSTMKRIRSLYDPASFTQTVQCPSFDPSIEHPSSFQFVIQYIRNDELRETHDPVSIQNRIYNCCEEKHCFCYPWHDQYMNNNNNGGRTILVANTGAHIKTIDSFQRAIHTFFNDLYAPRFSHKRASGGGGDIVFIRTNAPGHLNCHRSGLRPFDNIHDYYRDAQEQQEESSSKQRVVTRTTTETRIENIPDEKQLSWLPSAYNSTTVEWYNVIIRGLVDREEEKRKQAYSMYHSRYDGAGVHDEHVELHVLDVFNMTVLRPDGHMGGEFKGHKSQENDCIHYSIPGPVDWWNHLLYSNLVDILSSKHAVDN